MYGIDEEQMKVLHHAERCHGAFYQNPALLTAVLRKNSELVYEFLAGMPKAKNTENLGIRIDYMLPTRTALNEVFRGMFHPKFAFEERGEITTIVCDENAQEPKIPPYPPYLHTVQLSGLEHAVELTQNVIEKGYFMYSAEIGNPFDARSQKGEKELAYDDVGVGGLVLWYVISGRFYDPSASVQVEKAHIKWFWDNTSRKTIEAACKELNKKFFRKKKSRQTPKKLIPIKFDAHQR